MEKKIFSAMILTVAIAAFLTVYWLLEPQRVRVEAETMRTKSAEKGKPLYMTHCARCHGETGGPQKRVKAINSKNYLEAVDDAILYKSSNGNPQNRNGGTEIAKEASQSGTASSTSRLYRWEKTRPRCLRNPKRTTVFIQEEVALRVESCIDAMKASIRNISTPGENHRWQQRLFLSSGRKKTRPDVSPAMQRDTISRRKLIKKRMWGVRHAMALEKSTRI
jgi:cytochrome c553